jgi:hypothetical protein
VLDRAVSSGVDKVGDAIPIHAAQDVVVDGYVIVRADAGGEGSIASANPASGATPGQLMYNIDYITGIDGKKIRLTAAATNDHNTAAMSGTANDNINDARINGATAVAASSVASGLASSGVLSAVPFFGGIANIANMRGIVHKKSKPREAVIAANTDVRAFVLGTVHTRSNVLGTNATPAPQRAPGDDGYAH